ncbi:cysteine desulfurase/selenocysteine lyase [Clostridium algifaecis]|uniref:cysteine desulfurase n=1 Tax=Clostridium algifaecis TaxID=1472040 RepID=A0ABS4KUA2_9CLOT|nr:cysteine desulfurase [Clostridium algifaecis]MBP2033623.1 cysteine desulfurase/selenocysteine lyase [Clostridium algifaecis]
MSTLEAKVSKIDVEKIRKDFPILKLKVNDKDLVYLDNGATTQKPLAVIKAVEHYNENLNGNPHRGAHYLGVTSTEAYENARETVRKFIGAEKASEIIFTRNATESLNLIAYSYGLNFINKGDEIVIPVSEHHSNILPWQMVVKSKGAVLKYMYPNKDGRITEEEYKSKITDKTKIVAIAQMSNVLGTKYPVKEIAKYAHEKGAVVVIDGAQSAPHMKVDVKDLDADFFVFSGHKMLSSMGIGVLYAKEKFLLEMPPFLRGGDMIEYVTEQDATFAELPFKFEAGTQNVEGAVSLAAAIEYINSIGLDNIEAYETELTEYALKKVSEIDYVSVYGPKDVKDRGGIVSFNIKDVHPHDVATILNNYGVAVRSGHHCAQPLMKYLGIQASSRASFYFYNTYEEIDKFVESLKNVRKWLGYGRS